MGWLDKIRQWDAGPKYEKSAKRELEKIQQKVRRKYGDYDESQHHIVAGLCKDRIRQINEQGGAENNRYALALWQISKALYPTWIADDDRPTVVKQCWLD